jgi:D-arabinose 1-dehydrogenase-like Zn-dependent alcohol dehydrogenase
MPGPGPDAPEPPCVVGYEVAGVIDALGDGTQGCAAGERVLVHMAASSDRRPLVLRGQVGWA